MWLLSLTGIITLGAVAGGVLMARVGASPLTVAGLALVALGMFLASGWELGIGDPRLTVHLLIAGFGFGLVIAPITAHALASVGEDYRGTAASLVVVSRMMGMTLGLAALSAWGVEHFQVLTSGLEFPLPLPEEATSVFEARAAEYSANLNTAGLELFRRFFLVAAVISLVAIVPALGMGRRDRN